MVLKYDGPYLPKIAIHILLTTYRFSQIVFTVDLTLISLIMIQSLHHM